jgi:hypothetical protein
VQGVGAGSEWVERVELGEGLMNDDWIGREQSGRRGVLFGADSGSVLWWQEIPTFNVSFP